MAVDIKTFNEVVLSIINNIHTTRPNVDTKEGTFLNDTIIYPTSKEFNDLYTILQQLSLAQSILTAKGEDLDNLATNYFVTRKQGTTSNGKVRFYIKGSNNEQFSNTSSNPYPRIQISKYTIVSTTSNNTSPIQFQTMDDIDLQPQEVLNLSKDETGYRYIEILCESIDTGSDKNIGPFVITSLTGYSSSNIAFVSNPFSFNGGTDTENDNSLALRIALAVTGVNIGTKNGYLGFILKQPQIIDSIVIGGGDPFMNRDIVHVYNQNGELVEAHTGGKVDIYVRTNSIQTDTVNYVITTDDLNNENKYPIHLMPKDMKLPIIKINSIHGENIIDDKGTIEYINYINAGDYELERTLNTSIKKYYIDTLWDFSIKDYIMGNVYYDNLTSDEISRLKSKLDNQLIIAKKYLNNISSKIDWDVIEQIDVSQNSGLQDINLFTFGRYTDNNYYSLKVKLDTLDGQKIGDRTFVLKEDNFYIRDYIQPDFDLIREDTEYSMSVESKDYISWLPGSLNIPKVGETLVINYTYSSGIQDTQNLINENKILTDDVLIKMGIEKPLEIQINGTYSDSYDMIQLKTLISNALSEFINNRKHLGSFIDKSDIVQIVKEIDGIITVKLEDVFMNVINYPDEDTIICNPNQYFTLKNLIINLSVSTL